MAPKGYDKAKLVFACPFARLVLKHGAKPSWWADDAPTFRVVVAEGEIDFLTCAADASDANEHAAAVLGVTSGSWTAELAARVPDGAVVVVATDDDKGGEAYARRIVDTLAPRMRAGRVSVERWKPRA
jgi:DNA primase